MSNSIGDLKNSGLQGNNWPWQYKVLLGLDKIVSAIGDTEYEAQIILATCPGPVPASGYYLEVRIYNTTTGTFGAPVYYLPGSTTPVNLSTCTKEYANDSLVLTQILTELLDQGVTLDAIETSVQLIDNCVGTDGVIAPPNSFVIAGVTASGIQQTIDVGTNGHVHISDGGGSLTVDSNAAVRTPTILRTSASSSVLAGKFSMSFASVGTVDATVGGQTLKVGETISFDAGGINNTLGAVAYDSSAVGAELLIITLT
jgi:hypothetical protein